VNPGIFSALEAQGMPTGAFFTATILASAIGTLATAWGWEISGNSHLWGLFAIFVLRYVQKSL